MDLGYYFDTRVGLQRPILRDDRHDSFSLSSTGFSPAAQLRDRLNRSPTVKVFNFIPGIVLPALVLLRAFHEVPKPAAEGVHAAIKGLHRAIVSNVTDRRLGRSSILRHVFDEVGHSFEAGCGLREPGQELEDLFLGRRRDPSLVTSQTTSRTPVP